MVDIASIASFLLPTVLSMLSSGEGNQEIFSPSSKRHDQKTMYGYGYRYPKVPREVKILYTDPEYRYKWARAAVMNKGIADRSPWIAFLRREKYLEQISDLLKKAGREYRQLYGVNPKYKAAAQKKLSKIERALTAVQDPRLPELLKYEFGDKFKDKYITDAVDTLQKELAHLKEIINFKREGEAEPLPQLLPAPPEQPPQQPVAKGYGLREGLGYGLREGLGYGYGYGYFY
jgi:hypothetical protein